MKLLFMTALMMIQTQVSQAQQYSERQKCPMEVCQEPTLNAALKKYCNEATTEEFENSVDDWGPYLPLRGGACWCSCKFDTKQNLRKVEL